MNRQALGQTIQQRRVARLMQQKELAEACGVPLEVLDSIESGGNGYEIGQLAKVCDYLGIENGNSARYFFGCKTPHNKRMTHYNPNLGA